MLIGLTGFWPGNYQPPGNIAPWRRPSSHHMRDGAGPAELQALLSETTGALFAGARDEKLRRVIEFTYFRPAPKQEVTAQQLGLAFGTYRRHLATALDRLARWLWDRERGLRA